MIGFLKCLLKDAGNSFSSKRLAAFMTLIYTFTMYAVRGDDMPFDIFASLLFFAGGSLGISGIEKFASKR